MARVLIASDSPYINTGFSTVARFIGRILHDAGHAVYHLGFSDPRANDEVVKWAGRVIPWRVFQTKRSKADEFGQQTYESVIAQTNPQVIIIVADIWNSDHLLTTAPCPTVLLLHVEGRPLPSKVQTLIGGSPKDIILPQVLLHANHIITAGPFAREVIQERMLQYARAMGKGEQDIQNILKNTSTIIPDGVDAQVFHPVDRKGLKQKLFKLPDEAFLIGYFGRQNPRKGLPYAIQAFARWENRPDNAWMYLHTALKDSFGWNIMQLLADYGVADRVIIDPSIKVGGGCSEEMLNLFYNACFPGYTPVLTDDGYREIQDVRTGDRVISAEGQTRRVVNTMARKYEGPLCQVITNRSRCGVICTTNHKFKVLTGSGPAYVEAQRLELGDMILTPHFRMDLGRYTLLTNDECEANDSQAVLVDRKIESVVRYDEVSDHFHVEKRQGPVPFVKLEGITYLVSVVEDIKMFLSKGTVKVHNIEVEEDHSYVVCGMGVKNCDISVLPSTGEGAGLTLLESMAAGTPVITTQYAEAPNYLDRFAEYVRPAGVWVEPITNIERAIPDIDQLVQKFKKFYRDPGYRKDLAERGRAHLLENFDVAKVAPKWLAVVEASEKIKSRPHPIEEIEVTEGRRRICFVGSWFLPDLLGGGEITHHKILKEFQARGWDPYTLVVRSGLKEENVMVDGIRVTRADPSNMERKLMRYMNRVQPDMVITTLIDPKLTTLALGCAKEAGATTVYYEQFYNSICTKYTDVMRARPEDVAPWGKEVLSLSDLIYTNSAFVQAAMFKHQGFTSKIMHPFIDLNECRVENPAPEFITMINPDPGKGGGTFLYAVQNLPGEKFLAVKVSANADYKTMERMKDDMPQLTVWDFQSDVRKIYERTKLLLVPTVVDETFGRVIQEAQANGIPVIARDVGGIKDTLGAGGILLDKYADDDAWVKAIRDVLSDKALYDDLAAKGRVNAAKIDFKAEIEGLFQDVMSLRERPKSGPNKAPVCCVVPRNFYGVATVFQNMRDVFPGYVYIVDINEGTHFSSIMNQIHGQKPSLLVLAAWVPGYEEVIRQVRERLPDTKIVVTWFSNFSQMEFSVNNEMAIFGQLRDMMDKGTIHEVWMSDEGDVRALSAKDPRIKWLPCPIALKEAA